MRSRALHNGARRLLLWAQARGVSLRAVYLPGKDNVAADLLSRGSPLPGEWRLHPVIVQAIWDRFGRAQVDLFASQETTHCPWWYSMIQGHIGGGCPSVHMTPGPSVRFSPLPGAGPSEDVAGQNASGGPGLASSALDGGASDNAGGNPLASPGQAGHAHAGVGPAMASEPRVLQAACLAPGRGPSSDLGAAVIRTLQAARAPSTRGLYAGRWNRFCGWCHSRGENPVSCGVVLAFLQSLLESGLSLSTLRGYVAAISSRHELVDGLTMGTQALVGCFLKGARRLCPPRGRLIPARDLRVVLGALTEPRFEPLSGLGWELLSLKTVFLLAIASAKRLSELRALSAHPACLRLGGEGSAISLLPNPAFLPKVLPRSFVARPLGSGPLPSSSSRVAGGS